MRRPQAPNRCIRSSVRPAPIKPPMPRTSPARTLKETSASRLTPPPPSAPRPRASNRDRPQRRSAPREQVADLAADHVPDQHLAPRRRRRGASRLVVPVASTVTRSAIPRRSPRGGARCRRSRSPPCAARARARAAGAPRPRRRGRRLVKDQHARLLAQGLGDLHELALARPQLLHGAGRGRRRDPGAPATRARRGAPRPNRRGPPFRPVAEPHVLGDAQRRRRAPLLGDRGDPGALRAADAGELGVPSVDEKLVPRSCRSDGRRKGA